MSNDELIAKINAIQAKTGRWKLTGEELKISGGMAYRIAMQGYEPKDNHIRAVLGLAEMYPAPACKKCGKVHTTRDCVDARKRKPRWKRCEGHQAWRME